MCTSHVPRALLKTTDLVVVKGNSNKDWEREIEWPSIGMEDREKTVKS